MNLFTWYLHAAAGEMMKCANSDCGTEFDIPTDDASHRMPCPKCGSLSRQFQQTLPAASKTQVGMRVLGFGASKEKWFKRVHFEPSFSRKFQIWMHRLTILDKRTNEYRERVINPETGEVVYECSEPLADHVGHGSAKDKKDKKKPSGL